MSAMFDFESQAFPEAQAMLEAQSAFESNVVPGEFPGFIVTAPNFLRQRLKQREQTVKE